MSSAPRGANWLVALTVVACYICFIDRIAISVAIIPMAAENGWSATLQGSIMSAFFIGYLTLHAPAGFLADRFGGRWVLGIGVLLWSLFTMLTPPAAALSVGALLLCRFLMGMAEAVTYPSIYALYAQWVPLGRRSVSIGLLNSGIAGGSTIALLATPAIVELASWQWAFYLYGSLGVVWFALWTTTTRAGPDAPLAVAEQQHADEDPLHPPDLKPFTLANALRSRGVQAIIVANVAVNWVIYLLLSWLPTYVNQGLGVDFSQIGLVAVLPYATSVVATILGGRVGDVLLRRGMNRLRLRKTMQGLSLGGAALGLSVIGYTTSVEVAVAIVCITNFALGLTIAGFASNHMDIAPGHTGSLVGIAGMLGSLSSAVAVFVSGLLLDLTGSWTLVYQTAAVIALAGMVFYLRFASATREF